MSSATPKAVEELNLYVIYDSPKDFPGKYVVRRWLLDKPTLDYELFSSLTEARQALIKKNLYRIPRHRDDDTCIVETWV